MRHMRVSVCVCACEIDKLRTDKWIWMLLYVVCARCGECAPSRPQLQQQLHSKLKFKTFTTVDWLQLMHQFVKLYFRPRLMTAFIRQILIALPCHIACMAFICVCMDTKCISFYGAVCNPFVVQLCRSKRKVFSFSFLSSNCATRCIWLCGFDASVASTFSHWGGRHHFLNSNVFRYL